ncbi:MAG: class I SAM-dependent methyltransferase [Porticoccaceae bacterium]
MSDSHFIEHLGLKILKSSHPEVKRIKRKQSGHSAHGNKVWRSCFALIDYLETYPIEPKSNVLEVGCGWGVAGMYLTKKQQVTVTGIDIDPNVRDYFNLQNTINHCSQEFQERGFESLSSDDLSHYQYLIGSDICFWDELTNPLFQLICDAKNTGIKNILIADPGRPPFWHLADLCTEQLNSEVITRRILEPWKSEKYILVI